MGLMCHIIVAAVGRRCTETRNNPLKKETGALHGPEPGELSHYWSSKLALDDVVDVICSHTLFQNPSLAQVKIEEAKRELVSV